MSKPKLVETKKEENDQFQAMIENGVLISTVVFQSSIQSYGANGIVGEPETALYDKESKAKPSRTAEMYYHPAGLAVIQKYGKFIVPLANVKFARVK